MSTSFLIRGACVATPYLVAKWFDPGDKPLLQQRGMEAVQHQTVFTITIPVIMLCGPLLELDSVIPFIVCMAYYLCWLAIMLPCSKIHGPSKAIDFYVAFILPLYQMTLVLGMFLPTLVPGPQLSGHWMLGLTLLLVMFKIGVCMSVCLHRFAAHAAFKCGPLTTFVLSWLGCLANQGGPIWWASQHRCHHKFCDQARDPHSPEHMGIVRAFVFFTDSANHPIIDEFAPAHLDNWAIRLLDTFAAVPVALEFLVAYHLGGLHGLWVAYTSAWICQTVTLWFNVVNHPPHGDEQHTCVAQDTYDTSKIAAPSPFFRFLNWWLWTPGVIGEAAHCHHHDHPRCATRPGLDLPGLLFVRPLSALGAIWALCSK